jgi:hypothetical protein
MRREIYLGQELIGKCGFSVAMRIEARRLMEGDGDVYGRKSVAPRILDRYFK